MKGRGGKDVGIANRRGTRDTSPLARTKGVREASTTRDGDRIAEADGSLTSPEVLGPAPGEGIRARLTNPHVGKVLLRAPVGEDVEEAQKLPDVDMTQAIQFLQEVQLILYFISFQRRIGRNVQNYYGLKDGS